MPKPRKHISKSVSPERLKRWRAEKRFSQSQAAEFLNVPTRTYQNWEGGRPQAFPDWLRQQLQRPKKEKQPSVDPAQLSFKEAE